MLLLRAETLPEGPDWLYELKLDGYRAIAIKSVGSTELRSRNNNDFAPRYPALSAPLVNLPNNTVVDGEIVALDETGRPSFNALQNYGSSKAPLLFYVFDVLVLSGHDVMQYPLQRRRELLAEKVLPSLSDPVRFSPDLQAPLPDLIQSVKAQGLEGLVAKQLSSRYEPGLRSGAWMKMRINRGQAFVIGGYTPTPKNFDALIFGYYDPQGRLLYAARSRNGFTPRSREQLFRAFRRLETKDCPFANLPEARGGRWGQGLTAAKMLECRWLQPLLVAQFEYLEWTPDDHLRHTKFIALRDDKHAKDVRRES